MEVNLRLYISLNSEYSWYQGKTTSDSIYIKLRLISEN